MKRRQLLQGSAAALAAIGLNQIGLERRATRYGKALAQSTPRKLALLVGINDYPQPQLLQSFSAETLYGAVNDVELQRQLLIHRFGFHPNDIQTLTNDQATRENILTLYDEHLIKQAGDGDVVVFHFSGHGGRVEELDVCDTDACQNSTLVPYDYAAETEGETVQDIMGHTRFLMDSAFQTENVTIVLDCCYSGGGKRGNVVMRSRFSDQDLRGGPTTISPTELDYQQAWLSRLGWSEDEFIDKRRAGVAKGAVITSSKANQRSADYQFEGFAAGAFTYLLTKYLWQQTGTQAVEQTIKYVTRSTTRLSDHSQNPEYEPASGPIVQTQPLYQSAHNSPPGEAVVTEVVSDTRIRLWLGGLDAQSLAAFDQGSTFTLLNRNGQVKGTITQDSPRDGLVAQGQVTEGRAEVGDLLQERVRTIPASVSLAVGLDDSLNADWQTIATQLSNRLAFLTSNRVPTQQAVQVIFGRFTEENRQTLMAQRVEDLPPVGSLGLFNPLLEPLPAAFDQPSESIEDAIARLQPRFKSLYITRILHLLLNAETSRLNISVSVKQSRGRGVPILATTPRSRGETLQPTLLTEAIEEIPVETQIELVLKNGEAQDLYMSLLVIDAHGEVTVLFPYDWDAPEDQALVQAGEEVPFPTIRAIPPEGITELLVIASNSQLRQALKTMQRLAPASHRGAIPLTEPGEVMAALLDDLSTQRGEPSAENQQRQMDTGQVAAVSLLYRVVAKTCDRGENEPPCSEPA
ncbi:MAG: caspase family protein [Cyanobacteria bacterium J06642_9]